MSDYTFEVSNIDWIGSNPFLPVTAYVMLSKHLVEADTSDDDAWDDAVNDELEDQFGCRASSFSFEPVE